MSLELVYNGVVTTLNGVVSSSTTVITLTSITGFPVVPRFRLRVDDELMLVTGISGSNFTVQRGVEGTTAVSHSDKATVYGVVTAGALRQMRNDPVADNNALVYKSADADVRLLFTLLALTASRTITVPDADIELFDRGEFDDHVNAEGSAVHGLGSMSIQDANNVQVTGGDVDGVTIGANNPESGKFTTLDVTDEVNGYMVDGIKVLGARQHGWADPTGASSRASFDPSTVTLPQLAQVVSALYADLKAHGLIGS